MEFLAKAVDTCRMLNDLDLPLAVPVFLKERRKAKKWTQERLAHEANVSTTAIHNLEAGKNGFTDKTLSALAKALGCRPADLLLPMNWHGSKITTEAEIDNMLNRIEGLSPTDIGVARAVIVNSLHAKQGGSERTDFRDPQLTSTRRHAEEPSR